jgi:hypothetical protein
MKYSNKMLYIGAGCHVEPVLHFKETKEFIFIDTQPRSEYDSIEFESLFYRKKFIDNLEEEFKKYDFTIQNVYELDNKYFNKIISWKQYIYYLFFKIPKFINPALIIFENQKTKQIVKYYISTNFKLNMNNKLKEDIKTSDGLIISGFFPQTELLDFFDKPKTFFGYTDTIYNIEENNTDKDTIIYFLHTSICNTPYFFKNFFMIKRESGIIIKCANFKNFVFMNNEKIY